MSEMVPFGRTVEGVAFDEISFGLDQTYQKRENLSEDEIDEMEVFPVDFWVCDFVLEMLFDKKRDA